MKEFNILPNESLQEKMDYFITPYNTSLMYKKYMEFEDEEKGLQRKRLSQKELSDEWKLVGKIFDTNPSSNFTSYTKVHYR